MWQSESFENEKELIILILGNAQYAAGGSGMGFFAINLGG